MKGDAEHDMFKYRVWSVKPTKRSEVRNRTLSDSVI
jgi:hypothetical protein